MDPIIWAAVIAGGVSVVGNGATMIVARFGRDTQREQLETTASVEIAKIAAESERVRDERREAARRERRELYGRLLAVIARLQRYDHDDPGPLSDDEYVADSLAYGLLHSEAFLLGTEAVQDQLSAVNEAFADIAANMRRFEGGPAQQFREASLENQRGRAVRTGSLIYAMRQDVTEPHLPE